MKKMKKLFSVCAGVLTMALCAGVFAGCGAEPTELTSNLISLEYTSVEYDGTEKEPAVKVIIDEEEVSSDEYIVEYSKNINVGTASVKIVANEDSKVLSGSVTVGFEITPVATTAATVAELEAGLNSGNFTEVVLTADLEIVTNKTVTIPEGKTVKVGNKVLTINGRIINNGTINTSTLITNNGTFTNNGEYVVNVGTYEELVAATGKATTIVLANNIEEGDAVKYSIDNRTSNTDLSLVLDLNGKSIERRVAVYYDTDAKINVTIKNGTIIAPESDPWAITIIGNANVDADAKIRIEGVTAIGSSAGISTNGSYSKGTVVAVDSTFGTNDEATYEFVTSTGAYLPALYNYRFENSTLIGQTGYYAKSGEHKIVNCTVKGVQESYVAPAYNGSGCQDTGSALVVDSSQGYKAPLNVEVDGGTLISAHGFAIEEVITYRTEAIESYSEITIKNNPSLTSGDGKDGISPLYVMDLSGVTQTNITNMVAELTNKIATATELEEQDKHTIAELEAQTGEDINFYLYVGDILNDVAIHSFSFGSTTYEINDVTTYEVQGTDVTIEDKVFYVDADGKAYVAISVLMESDEPSSIIVNGKAFPVA